MTDSNSSGVAAPGIAVPSLTRRVASADNVTGHVTTAATVGGALASVASWLLQLAHVPPPPEVTAALTVLFGIGASWLMQRASA